MHVVKIYVNKNYKIHWKYNTTEKESLHYRVYILYMKDENQMNRIMQERKIKILIHGEHSISIGYNLTLISIILLYEMWS